MRLGRNKVDECGSTAGFIWTKHLCILLLSMVSLVMIGRLPAQASSETVLEVSSYFGGATDGETMRDICIDRDGFIYLAVTTGSWDLPTNASSWDPEYNDDRTDRYRGDIYIAKLDPTDRNTVWSTYLGGPGIDEVYGIAVDRQGNVIISGRASDKFPVTPGAFQTSFMGPFEGRGGPHGSGQDAFVARFDAGGQLTWASYFGSSDGYDTGRDVAVDENGDIYLAAHYKGTGDYPPEVAQAFLNSPLGGTDSVIAKISSDGSKVLWGRYLGGSGNDLVPSIRVGADGYVYVDGSTTSTDFPVTENAYQTVHAGSEDAFVAKFSPDGSGLEYATFLGGSQSDGAAGKHGLAVDRAGHAYVVGFTSSPDFPTTEGAFQTQYAGGLEGNWEQTGDRFIAKLSPGGRYLLASTFAGGNRRDGGEGIAVDDQGQVYLSTFAYSDDFPVNDGAMQREKAAGPDGIAFILAADFSYAELSTYMGGSGNDNFRACAVGSDGSFTIVGSTNSPDWPVKNAMQPAFGGGSGDIIVVKLSPKEP